MLNIFYGCSALTSVTIPNSVKSIGWSAFKNCSSLTSVTIPNSVTSIGSDAFYGCNGLTAVHITDLVAWSMMELPGNPLELAHHLFLNGKEVKDLVIPNGVTSIGVGAFMGCSSLTSVTIPNSVTSIGHYAFDGCSGLTSVTIPNSVKFIGNNAFRDCSELTAIHISDLTAWCEMSQGSSFIPPLSYAHHLFLNGEEVKELVIPDNVTNISGLAFKGCSGLTSVTIPENVTSIGPYAFEGCSGLTSVILKIEEPFAFSLYAFDDIASTCTLTVPYGTKDAYIAKGWTEDVFKGGIIEASNLTSNNYLSIEDAEVCKGKNLVLPVNMSNTESITALQFEMTLPTGVSLSACQLTDRKGNDHTVSLKKLANGNYQVVVISMSSKAFSGKEGALVNLTLDVDNEMEAGDYPVIIKNIELTTTDTKAINPANVTAVLTVNNIKIGDANGDGKISITDAVAIVNYILGNPPTDFFVAAADVNGDNEVDVFDVTKIISIILSGEENAAKTRKVSGYQPFIAMEPLYIESSTNGMRMTIDNADRFTAFQMDVEVPDGTELKNTRLTMPETGHILRCAKTGENRYRIIALSLNNTPLSTTADGLLELGLSNSSDVQVSNILFVTPQGEEVQMESQSGNIATDIKDIETSTNTEIYDLSGQKLQTDPKHLPKGMYIINGKKVLVK